MDREQIFEERTERAPIALPLKTTLQGRYIIGRLLGKPGGYGITYLAFDDRLHVTVAIKEYFPRDLATRNSIEATVVPQTAADSDSFKFGLEQFLLEARTLAQFDHPSIVRIKDYFEENRTGYLIMPYYQGMTLEAFLETLPESRMDEQLAIGIMMPILDGLKVVHKKQLLHRDIKPENIYLNEETGRPVLLDFGAARTATAARSRSVTTVLTPGYAPYEQYMTRGNQGAWTDVYACGATLYRMLTGKRPVPAADRQLVDELEAPKALISSLSDGVNQVVLDSLRLKPGERIQSVEVLQEALEKVKSGSYEGMGSLAGESRQSESQQRDAAAKLSAQKDPNKDRNPVKSPPKSARTGNKVWMIVGGLFVFVMGYFGINVAPVANYDRISTNERSGGVTIDVLYNDEDVDKDRPLIDETLKIQEITEFPKHGTVVNRGDELFYTPNGSYNGSDYFKYKVADSRGNWSEGQVEVRIDSSRELRAEIRQRKEELRAIAEKRKEREEASRVARQYFSSTFLGRVNKTLSKVLLLDNFADNSNRWPVQDKPGGSYIQVRNGQHVLEQRQATYAVNSKIRLSHTDFIARYDIFLNTGDVYSGGGLVFRGTTTGDYRVITTARRGYAAYFYDQSKSSKKWEHLSSNEWQTSRFLKQNHSVKNEVELRVIGSSMAIYLNGSFVEQFNNLGKNSSGIWLGFTSLNDGEQLAFDNLVVIELE